MEKQSGRPPYNALSVYRSGHIHFRNGQLKEDGPADNLKIRITVNGKAQRINVDLIVMMTFNENFNPEVHEIKHKKDVNYCKENSIEYNSYDNLEVVDKNDESIKKAGSHNAVRIIRYDNANGEHNENTKIYNSIIAAAKDAGIGESNLRRYMRTCFDTQRLYPYSDTGFYWVKSDTCIENMAKDVDKHKIIVDKPVVIVYDLDHNFIDVIKNIEDAAQSFSVSPAKIRSVCNKNIPIDDCILVLGPHDDYKQDDDFIIEPGWKECINQFNMYKICYENSDIKNKRDKQSKSLKKYHTIEGYVTVSLCTERGSRKSQNYFLHSIYIITFIDSTFNINEKVEFVDGNKNNICEKNLILPKKGKWEKCFGYNRYEIDKFTGIIRNINTTETAKKYRDSENCVRLCTNDDPDKRNVVCIQHLIIKTFIDSNFDPKTHKFKFVNNNIEYKNKPENLCVLIDNREWKTCPNEFNKYEICKEGEIRNIETYDIMTRIYDKDGYASVRLTIDGSEQRFFVHYILFITFVDENFDKEFDITRIKFRDNDKANVSFDNVYIKDKTVPIKYPKWKRCPDQFDIFEVSKFGVVRDYDTKNIIDTKDNKGYKYILFPYINDDGKKRQIVRVHYLVGLTFLGKHPDPTYTIDHIDRIRDNNNIENLRWASKSLQMKNRSHEKKSGYSPNSIIVYYPDGTVKEFENANKASTELKVSTSVIYNSCIGKTKTTKSGYKFKYARDLIESSDDESSDDSEN